MDADGFSLGGLTVTKTWTHCEVVSEASVPWTITSYLLISVVKSVSEMSFVSKVYNKSPFADSVKSKLSKFGENNFDVIIDYGQTEHIISDYTLDKINNYLQTES